ncbi:MAG: ABC transporter ATP-binding protein [Pseudomonadota bacterium]
MISADGLGFTYSADKPALLKGCRFQVAAGDILAILGPNGAGKTTLLKLLLGLLTATEGTLRRSGRQAYVPQHSAIAFDYSVGDVVVMGASARNGLFAVPTRRDYRQAEVALGAVGLRQAADWRFSHLSGGQKQLALIARAFVSNPDVVVMDEPTSALDYPNQDLVLRAMRDLSLVGKAVVFTSHSPTQALQIADTVLLLGLKDGPLWGPAADILREEPLTALYGMPIGRYTVDGRVVIAPKFLHA